MEVIRSFISFDIKEVSVRRNLSLVQQKLVETGANLRLVKPENIHITLQFLGNINSMMVDRIIEEMMKLELMQFDVTVKGLGVFPNLSRIRVIWAGINEGVDELRKISGHLGNKLRTLGLGNSSRVFNPHLTIARVKTEHRKKQLTERIQELKDFDFGKVHASCLRLKKSVLTPEGPRYSVLGEIYS